jgi:hypothetical protein
MLLYANEFDIVGLVYSSSQWHYKGDGKGTTFTSEMPNTTKLYGERTDLRWPGTTWMDNAFTKKQDTAYMQSRWIDVFQNDFAARADWTVKSYKNANHPPAVTLSHAADLVVQPGETVSLAASTKDPDGDDVSYKWWQYEDVDSSPGPVSINDADKWKASFIVPADARAGQTIHIILEVTDSGSPRLTRYRRVIATVSAE